jgi:hypothetical protein
VPLKALKMENIWVRGDIVDEPPSSERRDLQPWTFVFSCGRRILSSDLYCDHDVMPRSPILRVHIFRM